jgi:hypothetical protein
VAVRAWGAVGAGAVVLAAVAPAGAWAAAPAAGPVAPVAPVSGITVSPAVGYPGGAVDLRTFADCGGGTGTVVSDALAEPVRLAPAADGGLFASGRIAAPAGAGPHRLVEVCGGTPVAVGWLTVRAVGAVRAGGGYLALQRPLRTAAGSSSDDGAAGAGDGVGAGYGADADGAGTGTAGGSAETRAAVEVVVAGALLAAAGGLLRLVRRTGGPGAR